MKKLIINADDFGLTPACDRAIEEALLAGAVSSASCLVWGPKVPALPPIVRLRSGVHLRLTDGEPLMLPCVVQSLVDGDGKFPHSQAAVAARHVNQAEVWVEWNAQIEEFESTGAIPTHLDSHRHTHDLPGVREAYADLCAEHGCAGVPLSERQRDELRARGVPTADFTEIRWTDGLDATLFRLLEEDFQLHDTVHLMTHPGVDDADLRKCSTMNAVRAREWKLLMASGTAAWLAGQRIHVTGMAGLSLPGSSPIGSVDILFLAYNRMEFTHAALDALIANTDWKCVRRVVLYDDGSTDGTADLLGRVSVLLMHCAGNVPVEMVRTKLGGPVAVMNDYLTQRRPAPWFVKLDNDVVVPPGWLPELLRVADNWPSIDLIGLEAMHQVNGEPCRRTVAPCGHIGGIGLMRTAAFAELPVPAGRLGFSDWQVKHDVRKAWLDPSLPVILLDRLPFEPWASLSAKYEASGWQRPWKRYTAEEHALWDWWRK